LSEPKKVLCHCKDCHKISGSAYSINFVVPHDAFKVTSGSPKVFSKTADSGATIDSFICGDCGSMMWRETETYKGMKVVKAGTLDDGMAIIGSEAPKAEIFTRSRVEWVPVVNGAGQSINA
jgi:hypothetical protein